MRKRNVGEATSRRQEAEDEATTTPAADSGTSDSDRGDRRAGDRGVSGNGSDSGPPAQTHPPPPQQQQAFIPQQVYDDDSFRWTCRIPKWLFWGVASFVISTSVMLAVYIALLRYVFMYPGVRAPTNMIEELGVDGVMLFRQYDRDDDGYLSIGEFEPLAHLLRQTNATFEYPVEIADSDEIITVKAYFSPLDMSTMTKDMNSVFAGSLDALIGLKSWQNPNIPWMNFGVSEFKAFLPKLESDMENVGKVYDIVIFDKGGYFDGPLSNNRYYPPRMKDEEVLFHRLLTLFHPRPFVHSRFSPQGSVACVRAYNDRFVSIVFRIHAEFQLNEPPFHPFWFTPAQFTGELIITRNASHIVHFNMYVPSDKKLNVDMEWLNGPRENENMEVDIGFLSLMELNTSSVSLPAVVEDTSLEGRSPTEGVKVVPEKISMKDVELSPLPEMQEIRESISWAEQISMEETMRNLELEMYKFKKVPYLEFSEAYERAAAEKKLVHSILLWGALDDQSC